MFEHKTNQEAMLVMKPEHFSQGAIPECVENLIGEKVTQGKILFDILGKKDIWFTFSDLSVRTKGKFYMKFTLMHIGW